MVAPKRGEILKLVQDSNGRPASGAEKINQGEMTDAESN